MSETRLLLSALWIVVILIYLVGLPTYPSLYGKFLLLFSMAFNGVSIWYPWNWV